MSKFKLCHRTHLIHKKFASEEESEEALELVEEKDDVRKRSESSPEEETPLVTVLSLLYSFTQPANFASVMLTGFSS